MVNYFKVMFIKAIDVCLLEIIIWAIVIGMIIVVGFRLY